jgi:hypothetical protein
MGGPVPAVLDDRDAGLRLPSFAAEQMIGSF